MKAHFKIVSVDDHPMFSFGLRESLQTINDDFFIKTITDPQSALEYLSVNRDTDLLLLDLTMPGMNGAAFLRAMQAREILVPVAILSAQDKIELLQETLALGVLGIISKNKRVDEISIDIRKILAGQLVIPDNIKRAMDSISKFSQENTQSVLSKRQYEILKMVQAGLSNSGIASVLYISELTVKSHLRTIFRILGAKNRMDCVRKAEALNILKRTSS